MLLLTALSCATSWTGPTDLDDPTPSAARDTAALEASETQDTGSLHDTAGADTAGPDPADQHPDQHPLADVGLYLNLGDSLAAGYDAASGGGYAWLLDENQAAWPTYAGQDLATTAGAQVLHVTDSGAKSDEILDNLRSTSLPSISGTVLVTISAGGNDFNDDLWTMADEHATRAVAEEVRANLAAMVAHLEAQYPDQDLRIGLLDIQDPTDGLGTIPSNYSEGFCEALLEWGWLIGPTAVANLAILNDAIAQEAAAQGATLIGYHDHFAGHGLNSSDGWMSDDCAHPTSLGHHELRRLIWATWTGEWH